MEAKDVIKRDLEFITGTCAEQFSQLAGKEFLLTGGAGFLGYYIVQSTLFWNKHNDESQQITLTLMDNFLRGVPDWLSQLQNKSDKLKVLQHDVTEPLPDDTRPFEFIIHAASIASPTYYRQYPIETMDANVKGLRNLLEYSKVRLGRRREVQGFLFFSSSEIYGNPSPENIPTPETYYGHVSCTGPRACYDESKRFGETLCVNFARQYGIPVKIARPFNNYGPGLKITDGRVIPDFARDVLQGKDIVLLSDGSPTRTFCYVSDAISGYLKILINGHGGESYNIGVERPELSMAQLADKICDIAKDILGYKGKVVRKVSADKHYLTDNPERRCPDISKAKSDLDYSPTISIDEGLKRSLIWYKENMKAEEA